MINSNKLKILAILCMVCDHIGYFFQSKLNYELYYTLRCIGRIAMPLFIFLLVQGFFKTVNLKKYILRIGSCAVITEIIIRILNYLNVTYFIETNVKPISFINILFSFMLILITLRIIDRKIFSDKILDIFTRIICVCLIASVYFVLNFDYQIYGLIIGIIMYFLEKVKNSKVTEKVNIKILKMLIFLIQVVLITPLYILATKSIIGEFSVVAFAILLLYNGKKGSKNKMISTMFYSFFPMHYLIIYVMALML